MDRLEPGQTTWTPQEGDPVQGAVRDFQDAGFDVDFSPMEDDAGNPVDVAFSVYVKSEQDAVVMRDLALKWKAGIIPWAKGTSAVGAGKDKGTMEMYNLKFRIAAKMLVKDIETLTLPEESFEKTPALGGLVGVYRSKVRHRAHRYIVPAHRDAVPLPIDGELSRILGEGHVTTQTLTTRSTAQDIATKVTSSRGPERNDASTKVVRVLSVGHKGPPKIHSGRDAVMHIGLNGGAGMVLAAESEVEREMPHEGGLLIKLPGKMEDAMLRHIPRIKSLLAKYTIDELNPSPDGGSPIVSAKYGEILIKGTDILARDGVDKAFQMMPKGRAKGDAGKLLQHMTDHDCEVALVINVRAGDEERLQHFIMEAMEPGSMGEDAPAHELNGIFQTLLEEGSILSGPREAVQGFVGADDMAAFRDIREMAADAARKSKRDGPSKSTDIDVLIDPTLPPAEYEARCRKVGEILMRLYASAKKNKAQGYLYGHAKAASLRGRNVKVTPRVSRMYRGGGMDIHFRRTLGVVNDPDMQERAAERMVVDTNEAAEYMYALLALNSIPGVEVIAGEKGLVFSPEVVQYMQDNPQQAEVAIAYWDFMMENGGPTYASRFAENFKLHARPVRIPEGVLNLFPRLPSGDPNEQLIDQYDVSIAADAQESHRYALWNLVYGEMNGLFRDWLQLGDLERVFTLSSLEKGVHQGVVSLTDFKNGKKSLDLRDPNVELPASLSDIDTVVINSIEQADDPLFANMKKVLALKGTDAITPEMREKVDVIVYDAKDFGASGEMGIVITNMKTIERERALKKAGNNTGYVDSFDKLNSMPHSTVMTPPLETIGKTAIALALKLGQQPIETEDSAQRRHERKASKIILAAGPTQNHPDTVTDARWFTEEERRIRCNPNAIRDLVEEDRELMREYFGLPENMFIGFGPSATETMEIVHSSLNTGVVVVARGGAFGDRNFDVARRFSRPGAKVEAVDMRWGTGFGSTLESTCREMRGSTHKRQDGQRPHAIVYWMVDNETSTGVQSNPDPVAEKLLNGSKSRRYLMVDGTSMIGSARRNFGRMGTMGSCQKFFGVPSGLSVMMIPEHMMDHSRETLALRDGRENLPPLYRTLPQMAEDPLNAAHNIRGMLQLRCVLKDFLARGGLDVLAAETAEKMAYLDEMIAQSQDFEHAVIDPIDRSNVERHIVCRTHSASALVTQLRSEGVIVSNAYGPYAVTDESFRVLLNPHNSLERFKTAVDKMRAAPAGLHKLMPTRPLVSRRLPPKGSEIQSA